MQYNKPEIEKFKFSEDIVQTSSAVVSTTTTMAPTFPTEPA